jgi:hypothetical protein
MIKHWKAYLFAVALILGSVAFNQTAIAQSAKPQIVHDSEYYILEMQHGDQWAAEDQELSKKLAELKQKYGTPPNIIHIMWDDTAVGEIGIPAIQKVRGFETPNMNRFAAEGINFMRMLVAPLLVVTPVLVKIKKKALLEYGALVTEHNQQFDQKWIRGKDRSDELIPGNPDSSSLIDLGSSFTVVRQMGFVPIDKPTLIALVAAAVLPMASVFLFAVPADRLLRLLKMFV